MFRKKCNFLKDSQYVRFIQRLSEDYFSSQFHAPRYGARNSFRSVDVSRELVAAIG